MSEGWNEEMAPAPSTACTFPQHTTLPQVGLRGLSAGGRLKADGKDLIILVMIISLKVRKREITSRGQNPALYCRARVHLFQSHQHIVGTFLDNFRAAFHLELMQNCT